MSYIFSWYDELKPTTGMESIVYFNHVVNELTPNADPNDVNLYTVESYLAALDRLPKNGGQFWIQLPYFQVYYDTNGKEQVIFEKYAYEIINKFAFDSRVVGFYIADEPEVWGTQWSSHVNTFDQEAAKRVYKHIKTVNAKKLALLVFCDPTLMRKTFKRHDLVLMTDILGFDFYPFETQEQVDKKGYGYVIKTQSETNHIRLRVTEFTKLISDYVWSSSLLMYVGQGTGEFDWDGNRTFGQRDPSSAELNILINVFYSQGIDFKRYSFWSKSYSNEAVWKNVWDHMASIEIFLPKDPRKPTVWQRIVKFFKNLL